MRHPEWAARAGNRSRRLVAPPPLVPGYRCGVTPEIQQLLRELGEARTGALRKLDGLSEVDARRSTVASGTNLAGLIQHLTFVESMWFGKVVGGRSEPQGTDRCGSIRR